MKGYRKDLKKANAKIENLQAMCLHPPPTPDRDSVSSGRSNASAEKQRGQHSVDSADSAQSGLGISLTEPAKTPTKSMPAKRTGAMLSPTPPPSSSGLSSPSPRPRTPLNAHKRLPKPPLSRDPSPKPAFATPSNTKVQRTETLRSLSESIISSYAKRTTPEAETENTPPSRDRSSEPLRSLGSPMAPLARFVSGQTLPANGD